MHRTAKGLVAALAAAAPFGVAQAAVASEEAERALNASSVAELLNPISNAVEIMAATEAERTAKADEQMQRAQLVVAYYHHHHHHHHRRHHHHHHHHHYS